MKQTKQNPETAMLMEGYPKNSTRILKPVDSFAEKCKKYSFLFTTRLKLLSKNSNMVRTPENK
uniref:Uncharacterized protein n=1 Tax=Romanomermis culicivorax TaxID=13658 RepID=A0A915HY10_ROMCU